MWNWVWSQPQSILLVQGVFSLGQFYLQILVLQKHRIKENKAKDSRMKVCKKEASAERFQKLLKVFPVLQKKDMSRQHKVCRVHTESRFPLPDSNPKSPHTVWDTNTPTTVHHKVLKRKTPHTQKFLTQKRLFIYLLIIFCPLLTNHFYKEQGSILNLSLTTFPLLIAPPFSFLCQIQSTLLQLLLKKDSLPSPFIALTAVAS